jgi:hypothetical protein
MEILKYMTPLDGRCRVGVHFLNDGIWANTNAGLSDGMAVVDAGLVLVV